ncbi:beta-lactamase/transpeptidase-like protein [Mycena maculata]|uniref:Beta-lactamase/transpeptidase-like protein n=1 Tax=Mycena maculata TaxID=230809 RepID=A0AAD7JMR5_9AGAR|nr:beta-lactamase/transpeptidase-like protein [Mycena maculata]
MEGQGSWLVETKGYGIANANGTKVTPDTIFGIGSNSKLFDILATGLLISNDSISPPISWTTKLASVISGWNLTDPVASSESTITDLMGHRTGMPAHDFSYFVLNDTIPAMLQRLQHLKPSTGFREVYQYNNFMYAALSYLPTALLPHQPPFASYVKDNIIDPLGMNSTTYSFAVANATGRLADGFAREGVNTTADPLAAGIPHALPFWLADIDDDHNTLWGPGGVLSTVVDAARWLQMLLSNGQDPTTNATIIPSSVIQMAATGVTVVTGNTPEPELSPPVYGGGQVQWSYRGHDTVEHNGGFPGFFTQITRFPNDGVGLAVFTNEDPALGLGFYTNNIIKYRLMDEIFGLDPVDWNSRYKDQAEQAALSVAALTSSPAPFDASLPFSLAAVEGNYRNLGYGPDIALCAPSVKSSNCSVLLARLNSTFPAELAQADLVWEWDSRMATYVSLTHFDGPLFNVSAWVPMPTGNASTPFWAYDSGLEGNVAEFALVEGKVSGFGIRGGIWIAGPTVGEPQGTSVEDRSEVFFDAVGW